ncbi:iron-containing alcohol dehydrogenase [Streptomyces sp. B1866]|uniref:iron-containing alcohol dehydrogenase n=1 Tax=Streptomyces sp. B1866 TaxID=3075431 RepID=UPI0028905884|nr:iron-containing alcohol dehydrogenase [Streptomyces sp. B1866]MDT3399122.1 iron-containing alcohol dehydrogenase [Streptomyces sp. B1866]
MTSRIAQPREMYVGGGAVERVADAVTALGVGRPLLVTDPYLHSTGQADRILGLLSGAGLAPGLFAETVPDPTTDCLDAALAALKGHGADCVVGFGGGSPMDSAKAVALLAAQGGHMSRYKAPRLNTGPALPVVAVPTTAGSGSEATQFTVVTDSATDEKMLCAGPAFLPVAAVVDYELTLSMPPRLTADTGVDALTHAVEAYVSRKANPFTDGLCLLAVSAVGRFLRRAVADGADREAREAMTLAATRAGIAFSNSSVALVHGMSRPIGAHFNVAHGLSNAMLFPAVTAFSVRAAEARYAACARALGVAGDARPDAAAADDLVEALRRLCADLDVPTPRRYGIEESAWTRAIPLMARQALASGSPANNPRVPDAAEIEELYARIYR